MDISLFNSFKSKTVKMDTMTIEERAKAVGTLVSGLLLRQIVLHILTLSLLFNSSSTLF